MQRTPNILFFSTMDASFIREDFETLSSRYNVHRQTGGGIVALFKIIAAMVQADLVFCWFASTYSAFCVAIAKRLGVKSIIVLGGVDVAADKEIGYGIWLKPWKARLVRYAIKNADRVLVVDLSLKREAMERAGYDGENIQYMPTGYDGLFWKPATEKKQMVLTVASAHDEIRFKVKGIDFLIETAQRMPATEFLVIGVKPELAYKFRPPMNMKFLPVVEKDELLTYYQQAKVYCQPSRREGLPNALCEAMLAGCVPVATKVGGSVTALGDIGFLVEYRDVEGLVHALRSAMEASVEVSAKARARIIALFPKEKRKKELLGIFQEFLA